MTCRDCKPLKELDGWDDLEGCLDGLFYGFCGDDNCYGLCAYLGHCSCECHKASDD